MRFQVDVNCDLGESYGAYRVGNDERLMPYISSVNIACGFHTGDPMVMANTVGLAKKHRVAFGAHPGYPDLMGFGRREMQLTREEVKNYVIYQVSSLEGFARTAGMNLQHVKPHGALYNTAAKDEQTSAAIVEAVKALDRNLIVFAPSKSVLAKVATKHRLRVAREVFADRAYNADGSLVSRRNPDAIIDQPRTVVGRAIRMVKEGVAAAVNGELVRLGVVHTLCVHGDTPTAPELVRALRKGLNRAGVEVKPVGLFMPEDQWST